MTLQSANRAEPSISSCDVLSLAGELVFGLEDPRDLVDATRSLLQRLFAPRVVSFGLASADETMVLLSSSREAEVPNETVLPLADSLVGRVLGAGELGSWNASSEERSELLAADPAWCGGPLLIAPLVCEDLELGVVEISWGAGAPEPSADQRALLSAVAGIVARALVKLHHRQSERRLSTATQERLSEFQRPAALSVGGYSEALDRLKHALTGRGTLVRGEPGSGKEVFVREAADSLGLPLRILRCHGAGEGDLRRQLFGEGTNPGWLEESVGGLVFIDEGSQLPLAIQRDLIPLLTEMRVQRVGEAQPQYSDARLVFATRREVANLESELLAAFGETVIVPPLREFESELPTIAEEILATLRRELSRGPSRLSESAVDELRAHGWPGNLRELRAILEIGASFASGEVLEIEDLALAWGSVRPETTTGIDEALPLSEAVAAFKRSRIERALSRTNGNQTRAAEYLGVRQPNLSRLMATLGMRSRRRES